MRVSSKVPVHAAAMGVVAYLAQRFTYLEAAAWQELVENGRITCNGRTCNPTTLIHPGDTITCDLPDVPVPPEVNLNYTIVYEDDWLLGIDKPGHLRVHSQGKFVTANLIYHLRTQHQPPYPEAELVNRLDADTSGVVLIARNKEVKRALSVQFAAGEVEKVYVAVVQGIPQPLTGSIDQPIGRVTGSRLRHRYGVMEGGKTAVTYYQTLATYGNHHALLELHPQTGRTHQLRVHLATIGHPIVGDALYTLNDEAFLDWVRERPLLPMMQGMTRQALHCCETRFTHPISDTTCTITAPLPADMEKLLEQVASYRLQVTNL